MSDFFESNLNLIKLNDPGLYETLMGYQFSDGYELTETKDGNINIRVYKNGMKYFIHSSYSPFKEALEWCENVTTENSQNDVIIVLGLGLAYHIEEMLKRFHGKRIIVIEPDINIFYILIKTCNIKNLLNNRNLKIIVSDDAKVILDSTLTWINNIPNCSVNFEVCPGYVGKYQDLIDSYHKGFIKRLKNAGLNLSTGAWFKDMWLGNFFGNIINIISKPSCSIFYNKFKNVPAVIVGAGPSIDKTIDIISKLKGKAVVFCAGSTYQLLSRKGIEPDFTVALDGNEENEIVFADIDKYNGQFIMSSQFYWKTARRINSKTTIMTTSSDDYQLWYNKIVGNEEKALVTGPSVSNVCLNIAYEMGMNPIILLGQDLCYTDDKLHGEGHLVQGRAKDLAYSLVKVKDMYGEDVYTREAFLYAKEYFEIFASKLGSDRTYLNATQGGLNIEGYKNESLDNIIKTYCNNDITEYTRLADKEYENSLNLVNNNYSDILNKCLEVFDDLKNGSKFILDTVREAFDILNNYNMEAEQEKFKNDAIDKLKGLERKIIDSDYYRNFFQIGLKELISALSLKVSTDLNAAGSSEKKYVIIYNAFLNQFGSIYEYASKVDEFIDTLKYELSNLSVPIKK